MSRTVAGRCGGRQLVSMLTQTVMICLSTLRHAEISELLVPISLASAAENQCASQRLGCATPMTGLTHMADGFHEDLPVFAFAMTRYMSHVTDV